MSQAAAPSWLDRAHRLAEWICVGIMVAIFLFFIAGIVMRYAFARPIEWADEFIMVLFLWTTFLTEALVLRDREQVRFDVVYDLCGPKGRRFIGLAGSALVAVLFLVAAPTVYDYVTFLWRERTVALQWRLDIVFACFVQYWAAVIVRALAAFVRLCRPNWQEEVALVQADQRSNVLG